MFWSLFYDDLLQLDLPTGVSVVGYADNMAVMTTFRNASLVEDILNPALEVVRRLTRNGLGLAEEKTEVVMLIRKLLTRLRSSESASIGYGSRGPFGTSTSIWIRNGISDPTADRWWRRRRRSPPQCPVCYPTLAVRRRPRVNFLPRLSTRSCCTRRRCRHTPPRLWREIGWSSASWSTRAIRAIRAYRTVSTEVAMFLLGLIPTDIVAIERASVATWSRSVCGDNCALAQIRTEERRGSIERRQRWWEESDTGLWTCRLFPKVTESSRAWTSLSFITTQALIGHGEFHAYLAKMTRAANSACWYCSCPVDDVEHTVFRCKA